MSNKHNIQLIKVEDYIFRLSSFQIVLCWSCAHYKKDSLFFKSNVRMDKVICALS